MHRAAAAIALIFALGLAGPVPRAAARARAEPAAAKAFPLSAESRPAAPVSWPGLDADAAARYREAIADIDHGHYDAAQALVSHSPLAAGRTLITWLWLTRPEGVATFADLADFITKHPDWPGQTLLRCRAETALANDPDDALAYDWLIRHPPLSGVGKLRLADALLSRGDRPAGLDELRQAWIEGKFTAEQEQTLLQNHHGMLSAADQDARLDRLLSGDDTDAVRRQLLRVTPDRRALGEARLALQAGAGDVDRLVAQVPPALRDDPGLAFDRERWRRRKGLDDQAVAILESPAAHQGDMVRWWPERHIEIRRALAVGEVSIAWRLARDNGLVPAAPGKSNSAYIDAEWLCGWIALRFQDDPQAARGDFQAVYDGAGAPITRARGAYWSGRAAEALKAPAEARLWYGRAARYPTTYYGQLALLRLSAGARLVLPPEPEPTPAMQRAFDRSTLVQAARVLAAAGQADRLHPFIARLDADARTAAEHQLVAALADHLGRLDLGVAVARQAERHGDIIVYRDFPLPPGLRRPPDAPELPLLYAVSRQESAFNPQVISPAGARGLMQLMPDTAKTIAAHLRLPYTLSRLTQEPGYNLRLGSVYLQSLIDRFDGNYLLAITAYNAGTTRVLDWMAAWGDPRHPDVDPVDWIELIPYAETRNYVQRVLEGLQVYRERLERGRGSRLQLTNDLSGHAPPES